MTRRRIAVVEDNPDNRLLLGAILGDLYELDEYVDGPTALAGMRLRAPDLALLDISLPGMEGPEVLKQLRASSGIPTFPVIALTAHAMAGDREKYLALGFDGYVTKPILDEEVLFAAIRALLPTR